LTWSVEWDERARKELRRLDPGVQRQILEYVRDRVATDDPRRFGRPLRGTMHGLWRYRIGSYRLICQIEGAASSCSSSLSLTAGTSMIDLS
jgi:mRNA interferase RelE/StbE